MQRTVRRSVAALIVLAAAHAAPARAQESAGYRQVVSANPFGLLLDLFNAEVERVVSESSTMGVGGSYGRDEDTDEFGNTQDSSYFNGDVFFRFYPGGRPLEGWNFGLKVGATRQKGWSESSTNFGYGFDANHSWLLGRNGNFYVGVGFGLKRLLGDIPDGALRVIPTLRIVNVGFAF